MKRIFVVALLFTMIVLSACDSDLSTDMEMPEVQDQDNAIVETEIIQLDDVGQIEEEIEQVDLDKLPYELEAIPGYHPYVIRYYIEGRLMEDTVPYLAISTGGTTDRLMLQQAMRKEYVTNLSAYNENGLACKIDRMLTWDGESPRKGVYEADSYVYVFYLKNGLDVEINSVRTVDLLAFGSLDNYKVYWGSNAAREYGYGYQYRICDVHPGTGAEAGDTTTVINISLSSFDGKAEDGSRHTYYMIEDIDQYEVEHTGM